MRILTITGSVLILAVCGTFLFWWITSDDSSPIIISDGSIHLRHGNANVDHFHNDNGNAAQINADSHEPKAIHYGCQKSDNQDPNVCKNGQKECKPGALITTPCWVDVDKRSVSKWTMSLCENTPDCTSPGTLDVGWDIAQRNTMNVKAVGTLIHVSNNGKNQAELVHPGNSMQGATLVVTLANGTDVPLRFGVDEHAKWYPNIFTIDYRK